MLILSPYYLSLLCHVMLGSGSGGGSSGHDHVDIIAFPPGPVVGEGMAYPMLYWLIIDHG